MGSAVGHFLHPEQKKQTKRHRNKRFRRLCRPWINSCSLYFLAHEYRLKKTLFNRGQDVLVLTLNFLPSGSGNASSAGFSTQGGSQTTRPASACARMKSSPWRASVGTRTYFTHTQAHTLTDQLAGRGQRSHLWHLQRFHFFSLLFFFTLRNCLACHFLLDILQLLLPELAEVAQ